MTDWQEFVSTLVGSLAWPVSILVIAHMQRKRISDLLTRNIKTLKAGPTGVELEYWNSHIEEARSELREAATEVRSNTITEPGEAISGNEPSTEETIERSNKGRTASDVAAETTTRRSRTPPVDFEHVRNQLTALAQKAPAAAIGLGYSVLSQQLAALLDAAGLQVPTAKEDTAATVLAALAEANDLLPDMLTDVVFRMEELRNAHLHSFGVIDSRAAKKYVDVIIEVLDMLRIRISSLRPDTSPD
jgi:hypothetical protein